MSPQAFVKMLEQRATSAVRAASAAASAVATAASNSMGKAGGEAQGVSLYRRFRIFSFVVGVLQLMVLSLNVGGKMNRIGGFIVVVGFFTLMINVAVASAAGWSSMTVFKKRMTVVIIAMTLIALLLWVIGDTMEKPSAALSVIILLLVVIPWVGVLMTPTKFPTPEQMAALSAKFQGQNQQAAPQPEREQSCGECIMYMLRRGAQNSARDEAVAKTNQE